MKSSRKTLLIAVLLAATPFLAQAFFQVTITNLATADLRTYTYGNNYQAGASQITVGGVPFYLGLLNNNTNSTAVVQSGVGAYNCTFSLPPGTSATAIYSLVNSAWGEPGYDEGRIVVTGAGGETATNEFVEGYNIRDHNNNIFDNTLSLSDTAVVSIYFLNGAPTTAAVSIQSRLDRQELLLPPAFATDTVATISFQGTAYGQPNGSAFLAALTLDTQPVSIPPLEIAQIGTNVILSWTNTAYQFSLVSSTNVIPAGPWSKVYPAPISIGNLNVVTNAITNRWVFYKLTQSTGNIQ